MAGFTISRSHSHDPVCSADGQELFHLTGPLDRTLTAVPVEPGANLRVGEAAELFEGPYNTTRDFRDWDVSPNGQRFLRLKVSGASPTVTDIFPEAVLVKNWFEELRRLVPVP